MSDSEPLILSHFPQIILALKEAAKVAVRQVAKQVSDEANNSAPYDTGFLASSGYWVASDFSNYSQAVAAADDIDGTRDTLEEVEPPSSPNEALVAYAASYAVYVHDGTGRMGARPWLAQTAEGASGRVLSTTSDVFSAAIAAAGIY